MEPKIKNATFATQCNPYQNMRYNSESEYIILMGDVFGFLIDSNQLESATSSGSISRERTVGAVFLLWMDPAPEIWCAGDASPLSAEPA